MAEQAINSYRDLKVWQEAMALAEACYRLSEIFPRDELYGLSAQIKRSSVSVAANIAEGHGRESTGSFIQHLRIAQGSLKETETHALIAVRVGLLSAEEIIELMQKCDSLGRQLRALIRSLQQRSLDQQRSVEE